jgi:hypothetical protein
MPGIKAFRFVLFTLKSLKARAGEAKVREFVQSFKVPLRAKLPADHSDADFAEELQKQVRRGWGGVGGWGGESQARAGADRAALACSDSWGCGMGDLGPGCSYRGLMG